MVAAGPAAGGGSENETGTTLDQTIVSEGDRDLAYGPGEVRVTRTLGWDQKKGRGEPLAAFKQLSDIHVLDEESPARVEYFDRCDPSLSSAYRVQEAMTTQVGESMLRQLAAIKKGPVTSAPFSFAISTGDNIDNSQLNELRWFIDLLDGGEIDPNSGGETYDGYTRTEFSEALDNETLLAAQQPFDSTGLGIPWYAVLGNHDGLIQGQVASTQTFQFITLGGTKAFTSVDDYECPADPTDLDQLRAAQQDTFLETGRSVPSDRLRQLLDRQGIIDEYFTTTGKPKGHGLGLAPNDPLVEGDRAGYYSFPIARKIQGISLETLNYEGSDRGHIPDPQWQWLERQLKRYSKVYYTESGVKKRNRSASNKMLVLFSHHSSVTMSNPGSNEAEMPYHCFEPTDAEGCADGEGLRSLLDRYPNVIAWANGHEHENNIRPYPAAEGTAVTRGFWEINTASHIDWPQQSRLIEIAWKPGKKADSVFIYTTLVDHGAAPDPDPATQDPVGYLASVSRVESYYDACVREFQAECDAGGEATDRNVKLVLKAPFDLGP